LHRIDPQTLIAPPDHSFVRRGDAFGDWGAIQPYFDDLRARPLRSVADVERWLLDCSELRSALDEERNVREVAMTCQTDDAEKERAYLDFIERIDPPARIAWDELDRKLLACPYHAELPPQRYGVLLRSVRNRVELFREANVALETEDDKLRQQYQKLCGAMTVQLDGKELTLEQTGRYLDLPDRPKRQEAWEAIWTRRLRDRDAIDALFDEMLGIRQRIARNADCRDYREYAFRDMERFDYTPADCERFAATIERVGVPAMRERRAERAARLGVAPLRPWDLSVDVRGRPPLRPFETADELVAKGRRAFERVSPELAAQFDAMRSAGLLDLSSRKGKAPGGYMTTFELRRVPFIFMNAVGQHRDVETLLHEGGHAFHAFATRGEPLDEYRHAPIEFAEVASMAMELLAMDALDEFYSPADFNRARREQLEGIVLFFPWMAMIDAFQHWLYTHAGHTRDERRAAWLGLRKRFGGPEDYGGYADAETCMWHKQLHPFTHPFYYVEYGIAQLGALMIWQNSRRDFAKAVRDYRAALALGGSRPLPELFAAAGAKFDFSEEAFAPLIADLRAAIAEIRDE
jgi:oligoendopeptidase F